MAAEQRKSGGLQVNEDRAWQEKFWTAQRVSWIAMALVIVVAVLGLTGKGGPFASASARSASGTIEYPRITRWQSQEEVAVRLAPSAAGKVDLLLSPSFARLFSIKSVVPEPSSVATTGAGQRFTFEVGPGEDEKTIIFNVTTGRPVLGQPVEARIGNLQPVRMNVTVLP